MVKKFIGGALLITFIAVLVIGAIHRTNALQNKLGGDSEGRGNGQSEAAPSGGNGNGNQNNDATTTMVAWQEFTGVVTAVSADELLIETADGILIEVAGRPWNYAQGQTFTAAIGDALSLTAYLEDGEYKVGYLENRQTSFGVQLRDEYGAPAWRGGRGNS